jgi:SAM-dependent methyltransferase
MNAINSPDIYDAIGSYIAEIYDQVETQRDDVNLLLSLLGDPGKRVLEPFCGHGRILLALAEEGHQSLGLDHSKEMLTCLAARYGELPSSWTRAGVHENAFPTGLCQDGTRLHGTLETVWHDAQRRQARFWRTATLTFPGCGRVETRDWTQQKHGPSTEEMTDWLESHGFEIVSLWGALSRGVYPQRGSSRRCGAQAMTPQSSDLLTRMRMCSCTISV